MSTPNTPPPQGGGYYAPPPQGGGYYAPPPQGGGYYAPPPPPGGVFPSMPPPPAAKKKHRKWPWIVLGVFVVIGIIAVSASGNKGGSNTASSPSSDAAVSAAAAVGIGTPVRDGKFEFVVQDVGGGVPTIGTDAIGAKAQGKFVLVKVKITNIGDEPQTFFGSNTKAFDTAGKQYAPDTTAAIYLPDSNSLLTPVNPGNSVTGVIAFDVPKNSKLSSIELHDSAFSGGVTVGL